MSVASLGTAEQAPGDGMALSWGPFTGALHIHDYLQNGGFIFVVMAPLAWMCAMVFRYWVFGVFRLAWRQGIGHKAWWCLAVQAATV